MLKRDLGAGPEGPATRRRGDAAEARALAWLQARGLVLVERNYRVAKGPHARGGEIDLILRERDGTLVFCEVRARRAAAQGGAAASIGQAKRQRLLFAAQHYLMRFASPPRCRFDVVAIDGDPDADPDGGRIAWLRGAFDASA